MIFQIKISAYFNNYLEIFTDLAVCHASQNIVNKSSSKKVKKLVLVSVLKIGWQIRIRIRPHYHRKLDPDPHIGQNSEDLEAQIES